MLVVFTKRFSYCIKWGSNSKLSTIMLSNESEQMNMFAIKHKADTHSKHLTHSNDCVYI